MAMRRLTRWPLCAAVLIATSALGGCTPASGHGPTGSSGGSSGTGPGLASAELHGRVMVGGKPVTAAEILVVVGGKVVATAPAAPAYVLPPIADCARASLVIRLSEPVIGVLPSSLASGCGGAHDIDVPSSQVVELRGVIELPSGQAFDWVELKLTPRLAAVAPTVLLAEGTSSDLREALVVRKLSRPEFDLRVLAGTWTLRADRFVDGPTGARAQNLALDQLKVTSGAAAAAAPQRGAVDLTLMADSSLELVLRGNAG